MKVALIFIVMIINVQSILAVELTQEFDTNDSFSMRFPAQWVEIPTEKLQQYSENAHKLSPRTSKEIYEYGYQLQPFDTWLTPPFVLVQVKRVGRFPESKLEEYKTMDLGHRTAIEDIRRKDPSAVKKIKTLELFYDSNRKMILKTETMQVPDIQNTTAFVAIKFTNFGYIQVTMCIKKDMFNTYKPIFLEIAKNINLDPEIEYERPLFEKSPKTVVIVVVIVAGSIVFIIVFVKRRNCGR